MIKKHLYKAIAKLAVILIIMSSLPVYAAVGGEGVISEKASGPNDTLSEDEPAGEEAGEEDLADDEPKEETLSAGEVKEEKEDTVSAGEVKEYTVSDGEAGEATVSCDEAGKEEAAPKDIEEAAAGEGDIPYITEVKICVYDDPDPDKPSSFYTCDTAAEYAYTPEENERSRYLTKRLLPFEDISEQAAKIKFIVKADMDNVKYAFERMGTNVYDEVESTGLTDNNFYICNTNGIYRIRVYSEISGKETMVYLKSEGMDHTSPKIDRAQVQNSGEPHYDKDGHKRYGWGNIIIIGHDNETALHEKPLMLDYPRGVWISGNTIAQPPGGVHWVAIRDVAGNYALINIDTTNMDPDPPFTVLSEDTENPVNRYGLRSTVYIDAVDKTGTPDEYISRDGENWNAENSFTVTENGTYDVYTRDVFGHVSKNSIEINSIDKECPQYSYTIEHDSRAAGYSKSQTLIVDAVDEKSGVTGKAYSYDGKKTWVEEGRLKISQNCLIKLCVRDGLKNEGPLTELSINDIDSVKPVITAASENRIKKAGIYASRSELIVEAKDEESGLPPDHVFFEKKGRWTIDNKLQVSQNGVYPFRVRDKVGNITASSIKVENLDPDPPECSIGGNPTSLTLSRVTLELDIADRLSGIKDIYMADARTGIKKLLKEYKSDKDGLGASIDRLEADITANGEYIFYIRDMCGNEKEEHVTVTRIVKPTVPEKKKEEEENEKGEEAKPSKDEKSESSSETVIIGAKASKTGSVKKEESSITVKGQTLSEGRTLREDEKTVSESRISRVNESGADVFEDKESISGNLLSDGDYDADYSTDLFENNAEENFSENGPKELELLPNPDEIDTGEKKKSNTAVIAATLLAIVVSLGALTVFLLVKKGLISLPDLKGSKDGDKPDT